MKLLIYSHYFAPSVGGVETIVLSLARGLANLRDTNDEREFEVTVATQTSAGNLEDQSLPFPVVRQPSMIRLWRLIRAADVVHIAGPSLAPLFLARLARKPAVVEHHGFQTVCPNGQLFIERSGEPCPGHFMARHYDVCLRCNAGEGWPRSGRLWLLTFLRRLLCAQAAANITPTQWLGGLLRLPRMVPIPHGLESTSILRLKTRSSGSRVIAFQGRLVTTKGVRLLVAAVRDLLQQGRSFELLIIGDGPEHAFLEQLAVETGLSAHIRFAGRLEPSELEAALDRAYLLVVPSLGGEVFGLVVAENMRRALPIVASDLGAFSEVLGDTGLTFRTGDAADLASSLARLLDDPRLAFRLGERAYQRSLSLFDLRRMLESHATVYRRVSKVA
jgi:glycogen(starch) synthase